MNSEFNSKNWEKYLKYGRRYFFKRKSIIYEEHSLGEEGFYYVKDGFVKVSTKTLREEEKTIDIIGEGRPFGEQASDGKPYFSTATALENCIIYFFPYDAMKSLMNSDHTFRMLMYNGLTEKLKLLTSNMMIRSLPSEQLLAQSILEIKQKYNDEKIPLTQQELSRYTGLTRITIYKIFKKWGGEIVRVENKNIVVKQPRSLRKIVTAS
ncbi:cAMP-binding domain of CRP or a regulatory subunit of cAMP-dependent protein kinases [Alteribacillus persepolensis]|uniref:cAMP-binding domain of CRP or a regulatory subunit of cAMP-dependent protein kinases n=1 Tax=Alteribacillus persepolensis TaxID=568899 RepID=A0A1G8J9P2_9BACI|nr:Crp/Fnr family transcriptional regulator [Alteribacillus persepolensis]SDI27370.1 cAMP-binding domain of CRP or a regulatory subunit of cAMP-dependent protein kinases [Alteribacillus persepolensis]